MTKLKNLDKELCDLSGNKFIIAIKENENGEKIDIVATPRKVLVDVLGSKSKPENGDDALHVHELALEIRDAKEDVVLKHNDVTLVKKSLDDAKLHTTLWATILKDHLEEVKEEEQEEVKEGNDA